MVVPRKFAGMGVTVLRMVPGGGTEILSPAKMVPPFVVMIVGFLSRISKAPLGPRLNLSAMPWSVSPA